MRFDLHIHSNYSLDGYLAVSDIIKIARHQGLSGIALTDHNTVKGGLEAKKYKDPDFKVIVGSEITTYRGEIIGLFLSEDIKSKDYEEAISEIRDQGGVVVLPHPFDELRRSALNPGEIEARLADLIEVYNSRCLFQRYNDRALEFAQMLKMGFTAGSDAHFGNEIGNADIITENEDLREAILKRDLVLFGRRSMIANHGFTKVLKLWRRTRSG